MIALIGSEGSMGRRYQAILNHMDEDFLAYDKIRVSNDEIIERAARCDRIIIATPTETHVDYLRAFLPLKKPILCEKPVTRGLDEIIDLHAECALNGWSYNMVMQYKELDLPLKTPRQPSHYNYFRPGKPEDGLAWNCMQIVGLANGPVSLKDDSPIWECVINGHRLSIEGMDGAYIAHIRKFIMGALSQPMDEILNIHKKVHAWKEANESN